MIITVNGSKIITVNGSKVLPNQSVCVFSLIACMCVLIHSPVNALRRPLELNTTYCVILHKLLPFPFVLLLL